MPSRSSRILLALLCLLILSWGTCPCVIAKAFAEAPENAEEMVVGCPCCQHKVHDNEQEEAPEPGLPQECPCCARSGANRPLPPVDVEIELPPAPSDFDLWFPELCTSSWEQPVEARWAWEATGPPVADLSLHGCPVGIVRLLN